MSVMTVTGVHLPSSACIWCGSTLIVRGTCTLFIIISYSSRNMYEIKLGLVAGGCALFLILYYQRSAT